jgi:hypothetical protein
MVEDTDWIHLARDRTQWRILLKMIMNFWFHRTWRIYRLCSMELVKSVQLKKSAAKLHVCFISVVVDNQTKRMCLWET